MQTESLASKHSMDRLPSVINNHWPHSGRLRGHKKTQKTMKQLLKNRWSRALTLSFAMMFAFGMEAYSQYVPSIPRNQQRTTRTTTRRNVAWGSQYDWLSTRYANYSDIQYMDRGQVRVMLNSIYARHGRYFRDANLRRYFNAQSWYRPWRNEVPSSAFNKYERANIAFLSKYD